MTVTTGKNKGGEPNGGQGNPASGPIAQGQSSRRRTPREKTTAGPARGQNFVAASGDVVRTEGEKTIVFTTKSGHTRRITFQLANVNNILAPFWLYLASCVYVQ